MEFYSRRLLKPLFGPCSPPGPPLRPLPPSLSRPLPPPPPPPTPQGKWEPPPAPFHQKTLNQKTLHQQTLFLFILVVVSAVSFGIAYALIAKYYFKRMAEIRRRRRRNLNPPVLFDTGDEASEDEDRGPVDHHIWYINTIGLPQSIIDSIAVFKYTREEGLIDGTECSVCLNEFSEDESLRLLPKCSHAFHLPCIDTWLRSHKNCPLCRAPVLRGSRSRDDHVIEESNVNVSVPQENTSGDSIREGSSPSSNPVDTPSDSGAIRESLKKDLKHKNSKSCELVGNELLEKRVAMEGEIQTQPIRRSASMSGPIGRFMNQRIMDNIVLMKNSKATSSADGNRNRGSSSVHRSTRSYSFGPSLQKGPVSMKRSSSSGKIWSSKTVEKTQHTGFTVV